MPHAITRRAFNTRLGLAAAGAALAPAVLSRLARAQAGALEWTDMGDGLHLATGGGGNALVVVGDGASLLIDCKVSGLGEALRRGAEELGVPLTHVVNTHHHADHTGGNPAFTADLPVLAHPNCGPRVLEQRTQERAEDPKSFVPTRRVGDREDLEVGGVRVQLRHIGPGHTDNDVFVVLPDHNAVHTGDLLFHRLHPFIDLPAGATTEGWQRSCEAIIDRCDGETVVVPGHGEVTDRSGLEAQVEYFDDVRAFVRDAIDKGKSREEVQAMDVPGYEDYGFERIRPRTLGAVYDELSG